MALTTAKQQVVRRDLTAKFDLGAVSTTPFYPTISTIIPSDGADEEYGWLGSMPGVREWLGDRQWNELRAADYRLVNRTWESSLKIKREHIDDDRLGIYGPILERLAMKAVRHPDKLMIDLLVNGETDLCFDGKSFFATDHAWGDSGAQDNDLVATVTSASSVTVSEFQDAWLESCSAMLGFKDDHGDSIHDTVVDNLTDLVCIVPLALRGVATKALEASLVNGGETNVVIDRPRIVVIPSLPSGVKFYTAKTDDPLGPLIFQPRKPLTREIAELDSIENKDAKFMTESRYAMGYGMWTNMVLTTFVTG